MTLVLDAGALYVQADRSDPHHSAVAELLQTEQAPLVTSVYAAALADELILARLGTEVEQAFVRDLADRTFEVEMLDESELRVVHDLARTHRHLRVGLAAMSVVVLARRHDTRRIVTLDERTYRTIEPLQGGAFEILPGGEQ